ncbi:hypothetical protein INR49_021841 [Caranx melampygus]|nr:hypothetical protein INR49_021841 [Caranx melampygus]
MAVLHTGSPRQRRHVGRLLHDWVPAAHALQDSAELDCRCDESEIKHRAAVRSALQHLYGRQTGHQASQAESAVREQKHREWAGPCLLNTEPPSPLSLPTTFRAVVQYPLFIVLNRTRRLPRQHHSGGEVVLHAHWSKLKRVPEHSNADWSEFNDETAQLGADWLEPARCLRAPENKLERVMPRSPRDRIECPLTGQQQKTGVSLMDVECLALKDLTSPRKGFTVGSEEDGGQSEQKENICSERRRSTPLKSAESTIPNLITSRKVSTPELAHITPIKRATLAEPWTPTANLKMLISAASPDIRDREMKKFCLDP